MRAGRLDTRLYLQQRVSPPNRDSAGEEMIEWENVRELWAEVTGIRGQEFFAGKQINSVATHSILFRYLPGVSTKMRFVDKSDESIKYDIVEAPPNARKTEIKALCVIRESEGWRG